MLVFPAILIPLSQRFQLDMVETLSLSFWMYLLFGVSALPWGMVADRLGARKMLVLYHLGAGVCGLLAAFFSDDPLLFSIALTGIGFFTGIYHPVGLGWIARDVRNTSIGMAYNGMFGNLGLAVAPLLAGVVNLFWGVTAVYGVVGLANLGGLLLLTDTGKNGEVEFAPQKEVESGRGLVSFGILLVAMMLGGIVYRGTSVTLPAYFELNNRQLFLWLEQMFGGIGTENVVATFATSMIYLVGIAGQYAGGKVGESYDLRKGYLIFHCITIPAAVAMALTSNIPLIGFALIHSFFLLGMQPIENTLVSRLAPPGLMSSAYGMKFILTFGVGALGVKVIEVVKPLYGLSAIYLALAVVSLVLVACIGVLMTKTRRLSRARR